MHIEISYSSYYARLHLHISRQVWVNWQAETRIARTMSCDCAEILSLIEAGKIDTTPLITHRYKLADIAEAYHLFENKLDGVIKVAVEPQGWQ